VAAAHPVGERISSSVERELFLDERGGLRVTWHGDEDALVLSVWRGDECRATFRLTPEDADRLADFLKRFAPVT
jgi:hypothetical protein